MERQEGEIKINAVRDICNARSLPPVAYSPDFHIGAVNHLAVAVPHAKPWARAGRVHPVFELLRRQSAECELPRPVDLDER